MNHATIDPATMVLHELRAPLGLMATAARSAADECQTEDLRQRCQMIVRAAEGMLRTANQLFQLNRAASAETLEPFRPFDVAVQLVDTLRGFDVRVVLLGDAASMCAQTLGVPERFEALLHSLLTNAMDHSDLGVPVTVELRTFEGALRIEIRNRPALVARHKGLGLGLAIADALAERAGTKVIRERCGEEYRVRFAIGLVPSAG